MHVEQVRLSLVGPNRDPAGTTADEAVLVQAYEEVACHGGRCRYRKAPYSQQECWADIRGVEVRCSAPEASAHLSLLLVSLRLPPYTHL